MEFIREGRELMSNAITRQAKQRRWERDAEGYLCIAPWFLGFLVFTLGPFVVSLYLGFTKWELIGPPQWAGLENFRRLLTDDKVLMSLYNTAFYTVFSVPLGIILAFFLALLLNQRIMGRAVFRTLFYIPAITPAVASAVLFLWILQPQYGLLNMGLHVLGIKGPNWLGSIRWVKPAIIIMSLWGIGNTIMIYLAGLQSVPQALYDAAEVDGANWWSKTIHVTLPMMTPTIFFTLVMGMIGSMQVFTPAYVLTAGGPGNASLFYVLYLYWTGFRWFNISYASVLAWLLFFIILILTLIQLRLSNRWVYYEVEMG
jgi:multiple sugar transport system permease protein